MGEELSLKTEDSTLPKKLEMTFTFAVSPSKPYKVILAIADNAGGIASPDTLKKYNSMANGVEVFLEQSKIVKTSATAEVKLETSVVLFGGAGIGLKRSIGNVCHNVAPSRGLRDSSRLVYPESDERANMPGNMHFSNIVQEHTKDSAKNKVVGLLTYHNGAYA